MRPTVVRGLLALSLVLLVLPLVLAKPGTPGSLRADEPAYLLGALSLAFDGDLRCDAKDLERLWHEYPYVPPSNVILMTNDGWQTLYFGKPYLYSFMAAPFAALFGSNGLVFFNALMVVAMIWMGADYLRRFNSDGLATLFATAFFLIGTTLPFMFWLHPEILNMFATVGCLYFGLRAVESWADDDPATLGTGSRWRRWLGVLAGRPAAVVLSASTLALGVYNKPMLAFMGVPVIVALAFGKRWRSVAGWLTSAVVTMAVIAGISFAFTGTPTAYLGFARAGFPVKTPFYVPTDLVAEADAQAQERMAAAAAMRAKREAEEGGEIDPEEAARIAAEKVVNEEKPVRSFWWIFRPPDLTWQESTEDAWYFLVGRHTGLFVYQPFSIVCLVLFAVSAWRSRTRWMILGALGAVALFFLGQIPFNWHGGGGFIGNRYFLMAYPGFLFLVREIRPRWSVVVPFAWAGLALGPLLISPVGLVVRDATLQAHARGNAYKALPLEHALRELPGHYGLVRDQLYLTMRRDQVRESELELMTLGGSRVTVWAHVLKPIESVTFKIHSPRPENPVRIRFGDDEVELIAGPQEQEVTFRPSRPDKRRWERGYDDYDRLDLHLLYEVVIEAEHGARPAWYGAPLPAWYGEAMQSFFAGVAFLPVETVYTGEPTISTY
ncbi:MAG: hypothetical protein AAGD38_01975 [Acidobacteriota bacterium]